ncbi:DUF547 domain-containing protein [Vibrio vulnificus]|nr:DUF547 domain-containing protein [Vibrio vulnificus]
MIIQKLVWSLCIVILTFSSARAGEFDHHQWDGLLKNYVVSNNGGISTEVDYWGMQKDHKLLKDYLRALSSVTKKQFDVWDTEEQLAFLINAYNAWTIELILTKWPDLESIKDLGHFLRSPWSREFVDLFGQTYSLDDLEHSLIRGSGRYNDPRIHFAVNCASIGCPALRAEAYESKSINQQLNEQTRLFLSDTTRNYVNEDSIHLSSIFKWYKEDFQRGWLGYERLEDFLVDYKETLNLSDDMQKRLKSGGVKIRYLDYDWGINGLTHKQ